MGQRVQEIKKINGKIRGVGADASVCPQIITNENEEGVIEEIEEHKHEYEYCHHYRRGDCGEKLCHLGSKT